MPGKPKIRLHHFNSIKVRLELYLPSDNSLHNLNFNSIKVRLELYMYVRVRTLYIFQFHKGTIRTCEPVKNFIASLSFQFHKGTIRTCQDYQSFRKEQNFNSIKVRLEQAIPARSLSPAPISIP